MTAPTQTKEGRDNVIFKLSRLLVPVCELDDGARQIIAREARVLRLAPEGVLEAADDEAWLTYVIRGDVAIRSTDGVLETVPSGSDRARRPLFHVCPQGLRAVARVHSVLVGFSRERFRFLLEEQRRPRHGDRPINSQQLFARVYGSWFDDSLPMPSVSPAIHLLYGAGAPADLRGTVDTLKVFPELAQSFIVAANQVQNYRLPARTAAESALRLTLSGARILALTLAVRPMFDAHGEASRCLADRVFAHSLLIGVLAFLLARRGGRVDPYRAFAAGLVHEAGAMTVPRYLDHRPEIHAADEACGVTMRRLRAVIGPALLTRMGFDEAFAAIAEQSEHWHRDIVPVSEADLLVAAHWLAAQDDPVISAPPFSSVPAVARAFPGASQDEHIEFLRRAFRLCAALRRRVAP